MISFESIYMQIVLLTFSTMHVVYNAINVFFGREDNLKDQLWLRFNCVNKEGVYKENFVIFSFLQGSKTHKPKPEPSLDDFNKWLNDGYLFSRTFLLILTSLTALFIIIRLTAKLFRTNEDYRTSHVVAPSRFTAKTNPKSWIEAFELYLQADSIFDEKKKVASFLSRIDDNCSKLIKSNCLLDGGLITYKSLKKAMLMLYTMNPTNQSENQEKFLMCKQKEDENVARYYTVLSQLCHKAFRGLAPTQSNKIIGERFIDGIISDVFRAELRKHVTVSKGIFSGRNEASQYATLLQYAVTLEQIYGRKAYDGIRINRIKQKSSIPFTVNNSENFNSSFNNSSCSSTTSNELTRTLAELNYVTKQQTCDICRQKGHIKINCPIRKLQQGKPDNIFKKNGLMSHPVNQSQHYNPTVLQHVFKNNQDAYEEVQGKRAIYGVCRIDGNTTQFIADTGSPKTLVDEAIIKLNGSKLNKVNYCVLTANGEPITVIGSKICEIQHARSKMCLEVLVVKNLGDKCIIGMDFLSKSPSTKKSIELLVQELNDGLQSTNSSHSSVKRSSNNSNYSHSEICNNSTRVLRLQVISNKEYNEINAIKRRHRYRIRC